MKTFCALFLAAVILGSVCADEATDFSFLVLGDWGGSEHGDYTTSGERATAAQMEKTAEKTSPSFVLALGDNFYSHGVKSVDDHRFQSTFEKVFTGSHMYIPWHVIAGNHDHYGNVNAQVQYTAKSKRWNFPSLWYTFTQQTSYGSVQLVMIDTVVLAGNSIVEHANGTWSNLPGDALPGPADAEMAQSEWDWLKSTLAASKADYLIVAGHYPVWSVCEHGPTKALVSKLLPILEKYKVTAYFQGHDHCAVHVKSHSEYVNYHTIGAAHLCDPSTKHVHSVPSSSLKFHWSAGKGAFASVRVGHTGLTVEHIAASGQSLYSVTHAKRTHADKEQQ